MSILFRRLADVCNDLLYKHNKIYSYYKNRNIKASTIKEYNLGVFPKDFRLLFQNLNPEELREAGVIWNASEGPFKNKKSYHPIVIPIKNANGDTIAIGCRTLMSEDKRKSLGVPKYLNTSYQKGAYVYGLDKAVDAIRKEDQVFVVEGYFDVISCHQAGIKNVVATCGTAFGILQLITLSRYTNNVCLLFDNDAPGHESARRTIRDLSNNPLIAVNLTHRFTPKGYKDIDEYLCHGGDLNFFKKAE